MGIIRFSTAVLIGLMLLSSGLIASGLDGLGVGTKATAMGGAFRAIANDWTAAYYNPAGYANMYDNQFGANLALVHFRNEITPDFKWNGQHETGILNDLSCYNKHEILGNPSAGFLVRLPVWGETVFGLSAFQPYDYNVSWILYEAQQPGFVYQTDEKLPGNQFQNNFDVVSFQLTAAREFIEEELSLGIGLQVLRGDLYYTGIVFRDNPNLQEYSDLAPRPYEKITQWISNDGYGWSMGFRTGMIWKRSEKLTLAATANIPLNLTVSGRSKLEFYMPDLEINTEPPSTVRYLLSAGDKVVDSADFETVLKLPPSIAVGAAYQVDEKLTLTADVEYTFWSRFDGLSFNFSNHSDIPKVIQDTPSNISELKNFLNADITNPVDWSNSTKLMAGASYVYTNYLTLLGGLSIDGSPAGSSEQFTPQFMDLGTKLGLSTGFIVHVQQWDLGLTTSYTQHPKTSVPTLEDINNDGNPDNFAGTFKAATYQTALSFNYRF